MDGEESNELVFVSETRAPTGRQWPRSPPLEIISETLRRKRPAAARTVAAEMHGPAERQGVPLNALASEECSWQAAFSQGTESRREWLKNVGAADSVWQECANDPRAEDAPQGPDSVVCLEGKSGMHCDRKGEEQERSSTLASRSDKRNCDAGKSLPADERTPTRDTEQENTRRSLHDSDPKNEDERSPCNTKTEKMHIVASVQCPQAQAMPEMSPAPGPKTTPSPEPQSASTPAVTPEQCNGKTLCSNAVTLSPVTAVPSPAPIERHSASFTGADMRWKHHHAGRLLCLACTSQNFLLTDELILRILYEYVLASHSILTLSRALDEEHMREMIEDVCVRFHGSRAFMDTMYEKYGKISIPLSLNQLNRKHNGRSLAEAANGPAHRKRPWYLQEAISNKLIDARVLAAHETKTRQQSSGASSVTVGKRPLDCDDDESALDQVVSSGSAPEGLSEEQKTLVSSFKGVKWAHVTKRGIPCLHCMARRRVDRIPDETVLRVMHECKERHAEVLENPDAASLSDLERRKQAACKLLYNSSHVPNIVLQVYKESHKYIMNLENDITSRLKIPGIYPTPQSPADTNKRQAMKKSRPEDDIHQECTSDDLDEVPEAPTFYPSEEEFQEPSAYLRKISALAKEFGICKIVPPDSWKQRKGDSKVSRAWDNIRTRIQPIHELMHRDQQCEETFGYAESEKCTVGEFEVAANSFEKRFLEQHHTCEVRGSRVAEKYGERLAYLEAKYWEIISSASQFSSTRLQPTYTLYANDMDSKDIYNADAEYGGPRPKSDPWNVNALPQSKHMLLSLISKYFEDMNLSGVAQPWIYFGMLFSTFCWHTEDNYLFSINHLHEGSSKFWYGVPGWGCESPERAFERAFAKVHFQKSKRDHSNILYNMLTMVSPSQLQKQNVPVYRLVQHAGEFVVTLPHAYHAGFSTGFNCAEAVNYALPSWFPYGFKCEERYKKWRKQPVFSTQLLMYLAFRAKEDVALKNIAISDEEHARFKSQFALVVDEERALRAECRKVGLACRSPEAMKGDAVNRICTHCEQPCDFSAVRIEIATSDDESGGENGASSEQVQVLYLCLEHGIRFRQYDGKGELAEYVPMQQLEDVLVRMSAHVPRPMPKLVMDAASEKRAALRHKVPHSDAPCVACLPSSSSNSQDAAEPLPWETPDALEAHLKSAFSVHTHAVVPAQAPATVPCFVSIRGMQHWWIMRVHALKGFSAFHFSSANYHSYADGKLRVYYDPSPQVEQPDRFFMAGTLRAVLFRKAGFPDQASAKGWWAANEDLFSGCNRTSGKTNVREWPMEAQFKTQ